MSRGMLFKAFKRADKTASACRCPLLDPSLVKNESRASTDLASVYDT